MYLDQPIHTDYPLQWEKCGQLGWSGQGYLASCKHVRGGVKVGTRVGRLLRHGLGEEEGSRGADGAIHEGRERTGEVEVAVC